MAEKYYGVNAYGYCAGNPVMMVDPDGMDIYLKVCPIISAVPPNWRTGIRQRERLEADGRAPAAEMMCPPKVGHKQKHYVQTI